MMLSSHSRIAIPYESHFFVEFYRKKSSFGNLNLRSNRTKLVREILNQRYVREWDKVGQLTTFSYRCPDKSTPIIHLDADPEEIGRNFPDSLPLVADASLGLDAVLAELGSAPTASDWNFDALSAQYESWYAEEIATATAEDGRLRPQPVMNLVNQELTDTDLIVCDASLASGWAAAYLQFKKAGRRLIAPRGLAGLGWGSPATIGAALASGKADRVIQFAGDGGFGYSLQELEVMNRLDLPVLTIVFNNDTLGWIKHVQKNYYDQNYVSTDFAHVDFATVAKGFGARSYTATTLDEISDILARERSPGGPVVVDVISDQWETPVLGL